MQCQCHTPQLPINLGLQDTVEDPMHYGAKATNHLITIITNLTIVFLIGKEDCFQHFTGKYLQPKVHVATLNSFCLLLCTGTMFIHLKF